MLQTVLNETDVDVLQELVNENRSARNEFLSDASLQIPPCVYPHLNPERYRKSLEQIEAYKVSGELDSLSFFDRQLAEMMLDFNFKKHTFLLAVCDWHSAENETQKADAAERHQAANQALYGLPDRGEFEAILCELLERIHPDTLNDADRQTYEELLALLPPLPANPRRMYRPADSVLQRFSELANEFYAPFLRHIPADQTSFSIQDAADITAEILRDELSEYAEKWSVIVDIGRVSAAVDQEERRILFPSDRIPNTYTRLSLVNIITHELGVHVLRAMPYQNMQIQAFSRGLPGYETIDEGIAKLMEQGVSGIYQESGIVHYITVGLAHFCNMNFRQIFEIQKRLQKLSGGASEIICYNSVQRAFRGTTALPVHKDLVYYNGAVQIWKFVEQRIDDPQLFDSLLLSAKTDIFNPAQMQLVYEAKNGKFV